MPKDKTKNTFYWITWSKQSGKEIWQVNVIKDLLKFIGEKPALESSFVNLQTYACNVV